MDALTHGPSPSPKQENRNHETPQKRPLFQKIKEVWMNPKETAATIGVGITYGIVIGALLLLPFPPKGIQAQSTPQPLPLPAVPVVYEVHVMRGFVRLCAPNAKAVNRIQRRRAVIAVRPLTRPAHLAFGKQLVVHSTKLSDNIGGRSRTKIKSTAAANNERAPPSSRGILHAVFPQLRWSSSAMRSQKLRACVRIFYGGEFAKPSPLLLPYLTKPTTKRPAISKVKLHARRKKNQPPEARGRSSRERVVAVQNSSKF